ncbi:phosphopantetheine attachment site domain protein [Streptomyces daqingensis]|jgi:acyl carrier protein|uniref:Phosphopantetheine attachment site domain protein n=1 Tax=Streptomyces daqingensis TaxID=1472640 RepID=A0ABQ2MG72_9ACTN|nr:acyl carrier protein [Streptomyces daqingensis]GGO51230.1 phosphopantetheine attachment site domain protein [Streptomyces daqingensis]
MSVPTTAPTAQSLSAWLVDRIGGYLQRPVEEIDTTVPLAEYGLDSVAALSLCGDIEEDFDLVVEPTVAWDYPTVEALTGHLLEEFAAGPGAA